MESHSEGLRGGGVGKDPRPCELDALVHEVAEVRKLRPRQLMEICSLPFISDEDVMTRSQRLDTRLEPGKEVIRPGVDGLLRNRLHKREQVLGAMIDFTQEKVDMLLMLLAFGYVGGKRDDVCRPSRPIAQQRHMLVHPRDLTMLGKTPVLDLERRYFLRNQLLDLARMPVAILRMHDRLEAQSPKFVFRVPAHIGIGRVARHHAAIEI